MMYGTCVRLVVVITLIAVMLHCAAIEKSNVYLPSTCSSEVRMNRDDSCTRVTNVDGLSV